MTTDRLDLSILIVDDDEESLVILQETLQYFTKEVQLATNGKDGFEKIKQRDFDIVITDICMPKMDGIELIKNIQELNSDISIIVSSAYSSDMNQITKIIDMGITKFVSKPVSLSLLRKMLEEIHYLKASQKSTQTLKKANQRYQNNIEKKDAIIAEQSRTALMGEMFAMITHQLSQPIGAMMMSAGGMKIKLDSGEELTQEEIYKSVELFIKNSEYLKETIEGFRLFYKNKNKKDINLKSLINSTINLISPLIKKSEIDVVVDIDDSIQICTYENELKQVIINLINNAKDILVEKKIKNPTIEIKALLNKRYIQIHVSDNAAALPKELESQIFNEYFTTKGDKGTGLGLYMSKLIVEKQLLGFIYASCDNHKTTFTIEMLNQIKCHKDSVTK
jgi:signal transduction histidine kinase